MNKQSCVQLDLSIPAYLAIKELLWHVKLGNGNVFETAVSTLVQDIEDMELDTPPLLKDMDEYVTPSLRFEYSDDEGAVITIE